MVLPPAPFKKWRTCPRCLPASKKSPQNPSISLALRPETIRHPDKRSKLENGATCGLGGKDRGRGMAEGQVRSLETPKDAQRGRPGDAQGGRPGTPRDRSGRQPEMN